MSEKARFHYITSNSLQREMLIEVGRKLYAWTIPMKPYFMIPSCINCRYWMKVGKNVQWVGISVMEWTNTLCNKWADALYIVCRDDTDMFT